MTAHHRYTEIKEVTDIKEVAEMGKHGWRLIETKKARIPQDSTSELFYEEVTFILGMPND